MAPFSAQKYASTILTKILGSHEADADEDANSTRGAKVSLNLLMTRQALVRSLKRAMVGDNNL